MIDCLHSQMLFNVAMLDFARTSNSAEWTFGWTELASHVDMFIHLLAGHVLPAGLFARNMLLATDCVMSASEVCRESCSTAVGAVDAAEDAR